MLGDMAELDGQRMKAMDKCTKKRESFHTNGSAYTQEIRKDL